MIKKYLLILFTTFFLMSIHNAFGQKNRINTNNNIGWYNYFGTYKIFPKFSLHTEYQWRRNNIITDWQQSLLRLGVNYNPNPRVLFRAGYAWIETFPYGEYSINALGRDFTEHRIFEMVQLSHKEGRIEFAHRFMLEQRYIGKYSSSSVSVEDEFLLTNRARYMVRIKAPLKGKEIKYKTPYIAFYDEIFIGFGQNVNINIFDQNRIGILLGYNFNKNAGIEAGYLTQTIQFGRQISGQYVFQNNRGLILNANFNFDLTKHLKK